MKKLFLPLSFLIITVTTNAQQRNGSILFDQGTDYKQVAHEPVPVSVTPHFDRDSRHGGSGERTTSGSNSRWYNYAADYLPNITSNVAYSAVYLWNDTTSLDAYSGSSGTEYLFNTIISAGMVCDPFITGWNDPITYHGYMQLTDTDAYTIDSVFISGIYYRNNANTVPVYTLTVAVNYGDGTTPSDLHFVARDTVNGNEWIYTEYGQDTLYYMRMPHDSADNHVDTFQGGFTPVINQIYLTSADTSANYQATIPVSINVPAGNMPAVSVTFKSGDPAFTFGDTVFQSGTYKYGMFRALLAYEGTTAAAVFPVNSRSDQNQGQYRYGGYNEPHHLYTPQWFWTSGGGAATLQYPYFAFHVTCATCSVLGADNVVNKTTAVNAFPNPANGMVNISFNLVSATKVTVTLTNVLGQEVAVQNMTNTASGKMVFNTSALPDGVYIYTLIADGQRALGRIMVAH